MFVRLGELSHFDDLSFPPVRGEKLFLKKDITGYYFFSQHIRISASAAAASHLTEVRSELQNQSKPLRQLLSRHVECAMRDRLSKISIIAKGEGT